MLFTGDACYTGDHWCDKCLPGLVASSSDAAASVKKLRKVAKEYDAKVVWGHDPVSWADWKKAPMFYYCLLYTSPSPRDRGCSRMPSSA